MCVKNIVNKMNRDGPAKIKDCGLSCNNRTYTKCNTMYCRVHGFQNKNYCKDCEDYE